MRRVSPLALLLLACAGRAAAAPRDDEPSPEDPRAVVFLHRLGPGEGAPSKAGLPKRVVLSETGAKLGDVVDAMKAGGATVIPFSADRMDASFDRLRHIAPGTVVVVLRPETLDVHFHFDFLERASRLDDDPFVDFAFGYVTGATPAEALAFAKGTSPKAPHAKSVLEFGPSRPHPLTEPTAHAFAEDFTVRRLAHAEGAQDVAASLAQASVGVLSAWGHGAPDGVSGGLKGRHLRASDLDLSGTLYFSGPCFCGVTSAWWEPRGNVAAERTVAANESFVLALLRAKATAVFAGLDPDRGETNHQELEHLLTSGESLGAAAKSTYDEAAVAYRRGKLVLPRHSTSRPAYRDIHDQMISGGACRALFGDPSYVPFEKAAKDPFAVETKADADGLAVTWTGDGGLGPYWGPVDVYRAGGTWTHRIVYRCEVERDVAASLRSFRVLSVTKDGQPLAYDYPTAALESWGGKVRVHGMLILPTADPKDRPLWGAKAYEAKFAFGR